MTETLRLDKNIIGADESIPGPLAEYLAQKRERTLAIIGTTALAGVALTTAGWLAGKRLLNHTA